MATVYSRQLIREYGDLFLGKDFEKLFSNIRELETCVLTEGRNNCRGYLDKNIFLEEVDDKYYIIRRRNDGNKIIKELTRNEFSEDFLKTFGKRIRRFSYYVNLPSIPEYIYHTRVDHYLDRILDIVHVRALDSKAVIPKFGKNITSDIRYKTENLVK